MPFIRGRYHINPIAGHALEEAREAEAARQAETDVQSEERQPSEGEEHSDSNFPQAGQAPIQRVEIEAAEMVPSHSGRAERGFVARVHRDPARFGSNPGSTIRQGSGAGSQKAETHVFSNHEDLVGFLHHELGKDCAGK